jgi:hypothetical protein
MNVFFQVCSVGSLGSLGSVGSLGSKKFGMLARRCLAWNVGTKIERS